MPKEAKCMLQAFGAGLDLDHYALDDPRRPIYKFCKLQTHSPALLLAYECR